MKKALILISVCMLGVATAATMRSLRGTGSWLVDFSDEGGRGVMIISQAAKPHMSAKIIFSEQSGFVSESVSLGKKRQKFTHGELMFSDTTVLPGRIILGVRGHSIDIMARAVIVDGVEHAWTPNLTLLVTKKTTEPNQALEPISGSRPHL